MRMKSSRRLRDGGFTLIEIMVVIAIIASLIGAGSLMLNIAQKKRMIADSQGRYNGLGAALEQIRSADQLGRYPPSQISKLIVAGFDGAKFGGQPNATNVGNEALYVVFRLPGMSVMPAGVDAESALGNTDDDKALTVVGKLQKPDLFEYLDAWGNPLVYFSASDYKDPSKVEQYVLGNGTSVKVAPLRNEKTGEFVRPDSFQLFSMGADQQPNTDDDLMYGM